MCNPVIPKCQSISRPKTPMKNWICCAAEFCERKGVPYTKSEIACTFGVLRYQVDYVLQDHDDNGQTLHQSELKALNAQKLTKRNLGYIENVIKGNWAEGHDLSLDELVQQLNLLVTAQTLRIAMARQSFYVFIACTKPYIDNATALPRQNASCLQG